MVQVVLAPDLQENLDYHLPLQHISHLKNTIPALELYRQSFRPSDVLKEPYAMVGVTVFAADQTERAEYLATSHYQRFLSLIRNTPGKLKAPVDSMDGLWSPYEKAMVDEQLSSTIIGDKEKKKNRIRSLY
ncbi:hypothetical protein BsIDN1_35580 [Bacillus safensis]|uniref:Uncharacterized protein n=1 Tax=Bacillus safensis TaxID=561879 RepID=A0A5S9M8Q8_BACIA|nr:hypothetical protein BsIDN1_35580 [Bacillus safensis]